jgi:hypothetical protein
VEPQTRSRKISHFAVSLWATPAILIWSVRREGNAGWGSNYAESLRLSRHAQVRLHQRGIRPAVLDLLIRFSDIELPAGNGCVQHSLSQGIGAAQEGHRASMVDRAARIAMITSGEDVITVYPQSPRRRKTPTRR